MAKLVLLLCLTVLLGVVWARERREEIARGRSLHMRSGQDDSHQQGGIHGFRRPMYRFPGRRGEDSATSDRHWSPRQGPWGEDRRAVRGREGLAGMSPSMKASDRMRQRLPHHRMVERLRQELGRFHDQRTTLRGQRRYLPDARASYDRTGRDPTGFDPTLWGPHVDPRVDLMHQGRGFSRRHLGNDPRDFGRFGPRGDHYPMRMGPGSRPGFGFGHPRGRGGPRFSIP